MPKVVWLILAVLLLSAAALRGRSVRDAARVQQEAALSAQGAVEKARDEAQEKLKKYEMPYDELLVLDDKPAQPKAACTMCCCRTTLGKCHVSCHRYKGGNNAQCSSLCAMKARGIPMPLEHGSEHESEHRH
jgi:hypothetical protein